MTEKSIETTIKTPASTSFDQPTHTWIIEYRETDWAEDDSEVISIFEYADEPLTEDIVIEEVRFSYSLFEADKSKSLKDMNVEIISVDREEC